MGVRCCLPTLGLLAMLIAPWARAGTGQSAPKFYAFCMEAGVPGVTPHPVREQAKMLRDLGFDGAGYTLWLDERLDENLRALDEAGLHVYLLEARIDLGPKAAAPYDPRLPDAIRKLRGRPVTVAVTLSGLKPGDPAGVQPAITALRELGGVAAEAGVRISVYNHANFWAESVPFIVELVKKADHPQVGFNFNLCHWLKVDGNEDYRPLLRENAAKLSCVTICGAQTGPQTSDKNWTSRLIQPLDQGDFDNRQLLATLREINYDGPVGLMCYGIAGDAREHLQRSMKVWKGWTMQP